MYDNIVIVIGVEDIIIGIYQLPSVFQKTESRSRFFGESLDCSNHNSQAVAGVGSGAQSDIHSKCYGSKGLT